MSDLPAPPANRLKPPSWLDGRLVVGIVLVLASVVVGAKVVASSGHFDEIWAAAGHPHAVFKLRPADLEALTGGAPVADVVQVPAA